MISVSYQTRFELRHLRSFLAIAEALSFRKAAESLHTAQPALTRQMSQLEEALGCRLFDRAKRQIKLTDAGRFLYQALPAVIDQLHETTLQAGRIASGQSAMLKFGYSSAAMSGFLPSIIRELRNRLESCDFSFVEETSNRLIEGVINERLDAAFILFRPENDLLKTIAIRAERTGLILPSGHPLAARKRVALKDLKDETLILFPRDTNPVMYDEIISWCHRAGFSPKEIVETAPRSTAIGLVAAGRGIATIAAALKNTCVEGTTYRPLVQPGPMINYACIVRPDCSGKWLDIVTAYIEKHLA